jgi:ATP-dependent RNA helicase RhlE
MADFNTFGLSKQLLRGIADAGFTEPRPIQAKTIPQVLDGEDVLGLAQTGMGKTAAFALPICERLMQGRGRGSRALILAPTRELVLQIEAEIKLLSKYTNLRTQTVFGGVGAQPQIRGLAQHPDIVIACPGRLLDLMGRRCVHLDGLEVLVLDEADHMFDMGFLPDIRRILGQLPSHRQNLFFSATMPKEIRGLTDRILRNPTVVELNHSQPAETIEHALYPVEQNDKTELLHHLFKQRKFESAIVFLRTKHRARRLAQTLSSAGWNAIALQGNMSQAQRVRAMDGFRKGQYKILVATDIAARGIDVARVSMVINFDMPSTPDAYTHRIGRTGRAERSGEACTFVTSEDHAMVRDIEKRLGSKINRVVTEGFEVREPSKSSSGTKSGGSQRGGGSRQGGGAPRRGGSARRRGGGGGGGRGRGRSGSSVRGSSSPRRGGSSESGAHHGAGKASPAFGAGAFNRPQEKERSSGSGSSGGSRGAGASRRRGRRGGRGRTR